MERFSESSGSAQAEAARSLFRAGLSEALDAELGRRLPQSLHEFLQGGKHLRPTLLSLLAEVRGFWNESAFRCSLAVELLHCASLLHDDVLDEHDTRRGDPTLRYLSSEKESVIFGDLMLGESLLVAPSSMASILGEAIHTLATASYREAQLQSNLEIDDLRELAELKTGVLFELTIRMTDQLARDMPSEEFESLLRFARTLGARYQLDNDVRDIAESLETRALVRDLKHRKPSYGLAVFLKNQQMKTLYFTDIQDSTTILAAFDQEEAEQRLTGLRAELDRELTASLSMLEPAMTEALNSFLSLAIDE